MNPFTLNYFCQKCKNTTIWKFFRMGPVLGASLRKAIAISQCCEFCDHAKMIERYAGRTKRG